MEKYRGKTLEEWRKYIKEDKQVGIRATKYILVLEELVEELSKLHQPTVISAVCKCCYQNRIILEEIEDVCTPICKICNKKI